MIGPGRIFRNRHQKLTFLSVLDDLACHIANRDDAHRRMHSAALDFVHLVVDFVAGAVELGHVDAAPPLGAEVQQGVRK